jgi:hypothetical protein
MAAPIAFDWRYGRAGLAPTGKESPYDATKRQEADYGALTIAVTF